MGQALSFPHRRRKTKVKVKVRGIMAILNHLTAILSHPWAFVDNLVRTFRIMAHRYKTFRVIRDIDGLEATMRTPLEPEGNLRFHKWLGVVL